MKEIRGKAFAQRMANLRCWYEWRITLACEGRATLLATGDAWLVSLPDGTIEIAGAS